MIQWEFLDVDFDNILLDKKSYKTYKNLLVDDISCKTFMCAKPSRKGSKKRWIYKNV